MQGERSYLLGYSEAEIRRLLCQAEMLRPITERLLKRAGLCEGMRVLDMGCGMGDVTLLAAAIVGPTGFVVGVDRSGETIGLARQRASERKVGNAGFEVAALPDMEGLKDFDAVIGRYVLVHQPDPVAFLRDILKCVKPGGLIVCHEAYPRFPICSSPPLQIWQDVGEFLRKAAAHLPGVDACEDIQQTFEQSGLRKREIYYEIPVIQHPQSELIEWVASSARTFAPLAEANGVEGAAVLDLPTFEQRSRDAMRKAGSHLTAWLQVCAWAII